MRQNSNFNLQLVIQLEYFTEILLRITLETLEAPMLEQFNLYSQISPLIDMIHISFLILQQKNIIGYKRSI